MHEASGFRSPTGAAGQTLSSQHAKLRPLAGRPMPAVSSKSPTGKSSPAQAAKPILKLSMQSSPERLKQPRHTTSITSVQNPVSSKGVNDLSSRDAKLASDTIISQMPCCSSEIQIQVAAAPVQLTLKKHPQDSRPAATPHTTSAPMSTAIITTGSAAQATYTLNQNKSASASLPTDSVHQDSTPAVSSLNDGLLAPGQTTDSEEVPVAPTHTAEVSLDTPPQETVCEAQGTEEIANAIIIASATQAMPAATSASAAAAEGAVAQQVPDSLQNPSANSSSEAKRGERSSGAPTFAEAAAAAGLTPALQHEDCNPTSVSTPQDMYAATITSPRAAVSPVGALRSKLAVDITCYAVPTNPICTSKPQAAASTTSPLDQPLSAPAQGPAANCPTDDEQAKQAERPKEGAVYKDLSESATTSTALCNALALSLPAPIKAVPTAASVSATGLAGRVPHTSASPPATKFAEPLAVPIKLEAVCMPFNLMGPSMLPALSPRTPAASVSPRAAASVSPHSRGGAPHVGFSLVSLLLCCNNLCCDCT